MKEEVRIRKQNKLTAHFFHYAAKVYADLWATISSKKSWSGEIKNRKKNGDSYWVRANIEPILDSDGDILGYQAIRQDITDKKTIELMSITDELTGLYNRRHFNFKIVEAIKEAKASGSLLTFFMMDVDNFKKYNDTYGHKRGDDVLKSVGKVMKEMLSLEGDIAFRLGGEEFGGIVNAKSFDEAKESVEAVRYMLENLKIEHSKNTASPYITASFGVICCDFSNNKNLDITRDNIYTKADECLYMAKENGRNRLECVLL
jgi:diguanylate cyclase (GGDEF)-like protein